MLFILLLLKLIPLYSLIFLGFIGAKLLKVTKESVATILIYIIAPIVIFYGTSMVELSVTNVSIPVLFFTLACCISLLFLKIGNVFYGTDSTKNILGFTAGTGNTGYFGLPVIMALLGPEYFGLAVFAILGFVLYENTLGFYLTARGSFTTKESLFKLLKLPTVYAFILGIIVNISDIEFSIDLIAFFDNFKGAYSILGIMIIGIGLQSCSFDRIDKHFLGFTFLAKFVVWPIVIGIVILLDKYFLHFFGEELYGLFIIMSIVPLASNTIALATELKVHPEKAAIAVLYSTLFALFYIPIMVSIFL